MAIAQSPTVQRHQLRRELRRARDAAGLKQADVARAMDWSPSKLIRIERGDVGVSTNDLRALLGHYGVDRARVNGLLELARSSRETDYYDQYADLFKTGFKDYLAYEGSASVIRQYDPVLVPGLLQTEEYGRAILKHVVGFGEKEVNRAWAARQRRQEIFERDDSPELSVVLDEAALRRRVGMGRVMLHQLERLKEQASRPNCTLQIIPYTVGAHPGMYGNFVLLEFADSSLEDLVHIESHEEVTIRDDVELIARYVEKFHEIEQLANPPEETVSFLDAMISEMFPAAAESMPKQAG